MTEELNFREGLQRIIERIEETSHRPILTAVYGLPNNGKSYLIKKLKDYFADKFEVCFYSGSTRESDFKHIKENPELFANSLFLFHQGVNILIPQGNDPNFLSKKILNRGLDLNIGIYNPLFDSSAIYGTTSPFSSLSPELDFDFIISNPHSTIKLQNPFM